MKIYLETERLILREILPTDDDGMFELDANPIVHQYLGKKPLKTKLEAKNVIQFINENYYAVKFNAEGTEEITYQDFIYTNPNYKKGRKGRNSTHFLAAALKISGYPSIVFFKDNGELIQVVTGYKTPTQLEIYLKMISNDDYKELTTIKAWEEYQDNFKGTFKD